MFPHPQFLKLPPKMCPHPLHHMALPCLNTWESMWCFGTGTHKYRYWQVHTTPSMVVVIRGSIYGYTEKHISQAVHYQKESHVGYKEHGTKKGKCKSNYSKLWLQMWILCEYWSLCASPYIPRDSKVHTQKLALKLTNQAATLIKIKRPGAMWHAFAARTTSLLLLLFLLFFQEAQEKGGNL